MCVYNANSHMCAAFIFFFYTVHSNDLFQIHFSGLLYCEQWLVRSRHIVCYDCGRYR